MDRFLTRFLTFHRELATLWRAFLAPETPWHLKALMLLVPAYLLSPIDLIPDIIPFADELLLGLGTLLLANWKRRKVEREVPADAPTRVVADYPRHDGDPAPGAKPPPLPDRTGPH